MYSIITILYGESYQRLKVAQLSVALLFIEFSLSEDCSCQTSKIITWINMICSANFLKSFKKERLSGILVILTYKENNIKLEEYIRS